MRPLATSKGLALIAAVSAAVGWFTPAATAQQSSPISLQGRLTGVPDGVQQVTLSVWDAQQGGSLVASATVSTVISDGVFSLWANLPDAAFDGSPRWWSAAVEGAAETGRTRVASSPTASFAKRIPGGTWPNNLSVSGSLVLGDFVRSYTENQAAFQDFFADSVVSSFRGSGVPASFYRVIGAVTSTSAGFGIAHGDQIASPVAWLYAPFGRNAFLVRAITSPNADPLDLNNAVPVFTAGFSGSGVAVGIGTDSPSDTLDVVGTTRTHILRITGGSDLAEPFPASPRDGEGIEPKPGMVLSIDPSNPGALRVSTEAYDTRVAGVYSGGNGLPTGMVMGKEGCDLTSAGEDRLPLAMAGRVWV